MGAARRGGIFPQSEIGGGRRRNAGEVSQSGPLSVKAYWVFECVPARSLPW